MPRSAADNQVLRETTRARLIAAALELFGRRGYASTPVDAVARAAGVSPGLLYHHFRGKRDLLHAIFEESMRDVDATFADADREPDSARRLATLLRSIAAHVKARRQFWMLAYGVRMQPEVLEGLGAALDASTTRILATLERYLRGVGWPDPALEAVLLFAQIDGLHQHYVLNPDHYPLDAAIERLIVRYGARPEPRRRQHGQKARTS
jgi:AcrR family transcriptional regulator